MKKLLSDEERVRKSRQADLERQHTTSFLMGLILVLAVFFVTLEWNSSDSEWNFFNTEDDELTAELELSPLHREENEVPMMVPDKPAPEQVKSEEVNPVEEDTELLPEVPEEPVAEPAKEEPKPEEEQKPEAVDMYDAPVDFRVVEDLPQFPGGAVEFMKWLTRNLHYPPQPSSARCRVGWWLSSRSIVTVPSPTSNWCSDLIPPVTERLSACCA